MKSIDAEVSNKYKQALNDYFKYNSFNFIPEKQASQINDLRKWMELVYLRERPLVAIDVEAWEKNIKKITEIGIVVYDPKESIDSIFPIIKPFHIVVREHKKMFNGRYVPDNKHKYMGGTSYDLPLVEGRKFIEAVIQKYINEQNGVLIGHHIEGDIRWLRNVGIKFSDDIPIVDTARLYRLTRSSGGTLRGVLRLVDIPHGHLHNAANDAYYTLLAAIAYCDPNFRRQKGLDVFNPENNNKHLDINKIQKRRDRLFDNSGIVSHPTGYGLFEDVFKEPISNALTIIEEIKNRTR